MSSVGLIHIATHGNKLAGERALSPNPGWTFQSPEKEDYILKISDVQAANLRASLVVLRCFQSGRGRISKGEGVVIIAHAFLAGEIPVRLPLPFKDQRLANKLREQLSDLTRKINAEVHPVFTSHKIKDELKAKELKPPIINQENVIYFFKCDLCDADYVTFTSRHLHQRVEEHKRSIIRNHVREQHGNEPYEVAKNLRVLRKCSNKFDCLIFEMFFYSGP